MNAKSSSIICIGNRFVDSDSVGPRVYDCLSHRSMPQRISLIDGGLLGLNLLRFVEGVSRVVFVDALEGFAPAGQPVVLNHSTALEERPVSYGHEGGLAYLLRMLTAVCGDDLPEIAVVGAESPISPDIVVQLADIALSIATGERDGWGQITAIDPAQPGTP